jgi:hypothetical protein
MKTFKQLISEVAEPVGDEKRFKDKHVVAVSDEPHNGDKVHKAMTTKKKRKADPEDDAALYEDDESGCACEEGEEDCDCDEEESKVKKPKLKEEFKEHYGDKWMSVMYAGATKNAVRGEVDLNEAVIDDLRTIVKKKSMKDVKFADGDTQKVDLFTASAMVKVHDALNGENQKKFADAINKSENGFMKMMDFSMSKVGGK